MSAIVVNAELPDKLLAAGQVVEIRDEAGQLLGQFTAAPMLGEIRDETGQVILRFPAAEPTVYVMEGDWPSDEEIERRVREDPRYTPEQVMERLRSLREKL